MMKHTSFRMRGQRLNRFVGYGLWFLIIAMACVAQAAAQTCTPAPTGLVSWWSGDGNALDSRSRVNGTLVGNAGFAAGKVGQAFNFDGVDDSVQIPHNPNQNIQGSFSAEAWVFPRSSPNIAPRIFEKASGPSFWSMQTGDGGTSNTLHVNINNVVLLTTGSVPLNQWTHVAFTYNGITGELKLFVNGSASAITGPVQTTTSTGPLFIGNESTNIRDFDGLIDEPAIYNRLLSDNEIQAIFNAGTAGKCKPTATIAPAGVIGWWAGDGNTNDISANGFNGALNSNTFAIAKVGQAFGFNDLSGISINDNGALNPQNFTIEAWFTAQPQNFAQGTQIIAAKSGSNGTFGYELAITPETFGPPDAGVLRFLVAGGVLGDLLDSGHRVVDGNFHHVAATYDGTTMTVFLDGTLSAQKPLTTTINYQANSTFVIGSRQAQGFITVYSGLIDELTFYSRALTQPEISSLFNAGIAGKLKSATTSTGSNVSSNVGGDATITFPNVTTAGTTQQIPLDPAALPALPAGFTHTGLAYDIATSASVSGNITLSFHLPCFTTSSQFDFLKILHLEGGTLVDRTVSQNFAARTLTASVLSLSPFVIAIGSTPTAVTLASFIATSYDKGVLLEWQTGYEAHNLGFRLYRQEGGQRTLVSPQLIAGSALTASSTLVAGQSYAWWDIGIVDCGSRIENCRNVTYWLEDIDLKGQSTWHGPFSVQQGNGTPPSRSQAPLLSALGKMQAGSTRPVEMTASPTHASAEQIRLQSSLAARSGVKIAVNREGWYRLTQPELAAAGFDTNVNPRLLQVFVDGNQLPILVQGEQDGSFDAGDSVEFYGISLDSPFTNSRLYWLVAGGQSGLRINQAKSEGTPSPSRSFTYTVERRDRNIYFSGLRNGEKENFFGAVVGQNPVDQEITLLHLAQPNSSQAQLEIALQGVTFGDHHVGVRLNGLPVGELSFHDQAQDSVRFAVANSILREGVNTVQLTALSGQSDISLVDYLRISYQHSYTADNDALKLTATGNQLVTIDGFTSKSIRVFDVTDPQSPEELLGEVKQEKSRYTVTFASRGQGQRELIAFTTEQRSASLLLNLPSNLRAGSADFIVVTRREFADALRPLVALRQKQALSVSLVDIEDIYDEFSFGQKSPYAVRDFLSYAKSNWKKKPRFVLFAGDASFDPKNYLGFGDSDLVPTKLIDTDLMETSSDDWLSDFDVDGIGDIATGRLPARTVEELSRMVLKIITYEQGAPSEEALLVADANEGFDFEQASDELRSLIPTSLRITQVNRGRLDPEMARSSLFEAVDRKQFLVNYTGHGSVTLWSGNLLTNADALALRNEHLPMFVMMTCLNGYFHDPALDSLGESLIKAETGGAVAVWASSGMTGPTDQALLNKELYRQLFNRVPALTLGEAVMRAKMATLSSDVRRTWILLGDPAIVLK